jgi:hypothetical protein
VLLRLALIGSRPIGLELLLERELGVELFRLLPETTARVLLLRPELTCALRVGRLPTEPRFCRLVPRVVCDAERRSVERVRFSVDFWRRLALELPGRL